MTEHGARRTLSYILVQIKHAMDSLQATYFWTNWKHTFI